MKRTVCFAVSLLVLCSIFTFSFSVYAASVPKMRVGLETEKSRVDFRVKSGQYEMVDTSTNLPITQLKQGQMYSVIKEGPTLRVCREEQPLSSPHKGPIKVSPINSNTTNTFSLMNIQYRGQLVIYNGDSGLIAVNILPVDEYLYGVVGKEIGYSAPLEALKAQAAASRSYALSCRGSSLHYDVGTGTSTQVYRGYSAELVQGADRIKTAVDATKGEVIKHNGSVIRAFFHSNAGGYTEDSENVWQNPVPYLQAVPSPLDEYALRYPEQTNGWPGTAYRWEKTFSKSELNQRIEQWNDTQIDRGNESSLIDIGNITDIAVKCLQRDGSGRTESGRVTELKLIGTDGERSFYRDYIRSVLGLRSTLFEVNFDSEVHIISSDGENREFHSGENIAVVDSENNVQNVNKDASHYYTLGRENLRKVNKNFENVQIAGKGYGHGLGLSQWGARGMAAERNASYKEIIKHYYSGVSIERIY